MALQIIEKSSEGLSKVFSVRVPAEDLGEKLEERISELTPRLNLRGFRPGKVPPAHVRRVYGKALMGEVIEKTLEETSQKVLDDNNLRVASQPDMTPESDMEQVIAGKEDLAYELTVEVMPDFEPISMTGLKLTRPVYEPTKAEVEEAVSELAEQNKSYAAKTAKTAKAEDGDQVLMDFVGTVDGVAFDGGSAEDMELVLGSGRFIPGFEEQLVGAKAGSDVTVKVTFPEEYQAANLAGKAAEFAVKVKEVRAPKATKIDDDLAKSLGMEDLAGLRDVLRSNLVSQYAGASRFKLKRALLDALDTGHDFPLPPRMVDAEFDGIWRQVQDDKESGGLAPEDEGKDDDQLQAEYRKIAERRVRLGLVLAEIGRRNGVTVSDAELNEAMRQEAMRYGPQAQQILELLRNNVNAQAQMRAPIFEDKVVDLILGAAQVTDKTVTKDELLAEDELPEGYGEEAPKKAAPKKGKAAKAAAEDTAEAEAKPEAKAKPAKKAKAEAAPAEEKPAKAAAKPKGKSKAD